MIRLYSVPASVTAALSARHQHHCRYDLFATRASLFILPAHTQAQYPGPGPSTLKPNERRGQMLCAALEYYLSRYSYVLRRPDARPYG